VRPALRMWTRSAAAALVFAALAGLLPLAPALRATTAADRGRIWLLAVWTAGVLAVLFGLSAWISVSRGLGFRDVARAGSVEAAAEEKRRARSDGIAAFAPSLAATGAVLLCIYFAGWLVLAR
jgi:hypothetical protein